MQDGFAPHRIPQSEGNHNGWLSEEEEADSDSESTASSCPNRFEMEDPMKVLKKMNLTLNASTRATGEDENPPDIATLLAQQLQNLLPEIVNQVTASVNANANNGKWIMVPMGNGNIGCTVQVVYVCTTQGRYVARFIGNKALTWWNTQVQVRGREAANVMSWNDFKALLVEEFCPSNEMERLENEF
ncbi:hypothetical protein Tco_1015507 [Tanacetum coccineum]|uniref:Retrotransposon gag domain-containing protein n=1 Tax=Tanacetum coccineum TaxID=301880 RepID=A0ABQ5FNH3_9ASTR